MTQVARLQKVLGFGLLLILLILPGGEGRSSSSSPMPFAQPSNRTGNESFSFIVYGDIQSNHKRGHNALVGQMLKESVDLVFNTGDISADKGKDYETDFYPVIEPLARRVPYFPAVGNHDVYFESPTSRSNIYSFFSKNYAYLSRLPGNEHLAEPDSQKLWYSLIHRDVLFVVLDSNFFIDEGKYRRTHELPPYKHHLREQLIWVRDLLESASRNPKLRASFVFFHHSPFFSDDNEPAPIVGVGGHPGHRGMLVNQTLPSEDTGEQGYLLDLFRKHRVTAVFTGHEHYYERWREVIRDKGHPVHTVNWIVNGLGGVRPRGHPKADEKEIEKLLNKKVYRRYLERISNLNRDWTAELKHRYPRYPGPSRFHNYALVRVESGKISLEIKGKRGFVRDREAL